MTTPNALVIISDGIEELETVAPIDCLRRAGVEVTVASAGSSIIVTGRNQIQITANILLDACSGEFTLIVVPGGPSHATMAEDARILHLLKSQNQANRLIGSICAGPVVLKKAGILEGKSYTSFPGTGDILTERDPDSKVVRDGNLITSQGAGTATEFALALVEAVCGASVARSISESICYSN